MTLAGVREAPCLNLIILLLIAAGACSDTSRPSKTLEGPPQENAAETPAPLQNPGKALIYNFDTDIATKFHVTHTGQGDRGEWRVISDPTAPSQPNAVAQTSSDDTSYRFPLLIADEGSFKDLDLGVKFKTVSGRVDQAAGLVFRFKDSNNYYVVRANALENNVVLYKVENGKRSDIDLKGEGNTYGKKASVPKQQWNQIRVLVVGNLFEVYLNGDRLFEVEDETFKEAGKIGLWTKADSVTYFDDLQVTAK